LKEKYRILRTVIRHTPQTVLLPAKEKKEGESAESELVTGLGRFPWECKRRGRSGNGVDHRLVASGGVGGEKGSTGGRSTEGGRRSMPERGPVDEKET